MSEHIIHFPELPSYLTVKVITGDLPTYTTLNGNTYTDDREGRTVRCEVHSTIHVTKVNKLPHSWSEGFVAAYPARFRGDILGTIINQYGLKQDPVSYS